MYVVSYWEFYGYNYTPIKKYFDSFVKAVKFYRNEIKYSPAFIHRTDDVKSCLFVR